MDGLGRNECNVMLGSVLVEMIELYGQSYRNKTGNFQFFRKYAVGNCFSAINSSI